MYLQPYYILFSATLQEHSKKKKKYPDYILQSCTCTVFHYSPSQLVTVQTACCIRAKVLHFQSIHLTGKQTRNNSNNHKNAEYLI